MLELVKMALRISADAYDSELNAYISAALSDLEIAGVILPDTPADDDLIVMAVITYCRMRFGTPDNYAQLKAAYDEQKAQLKTATNYTDWSV